jgi:hypothetical protein
MPTMNELGSSALASTGMSNGSNFGGGTLGQQAAQETDEERRKRLEAERQARLTGTSGAAALASVGALNPAGLGGAGALGGRFGL